MEKYLNFDIAIKDGNGVVRYVIPCSIEADEKRWDDFDRAVEKFAQLQLYNQGYETYGMKCWLEGAYLADHKGEYHFEGSGFEEV